MNYAETLYTKLWKTKGARFLAHKRLESLNRYSTYSISLNSIYVIILSLLSLQQFQYLSNFTSDHLSLLTLFLSVLIIVTSIIENSKNYSVNAELHHQCGKELNMIYEKLIQIKNNYDSNSDDKEEINKLGIKYQEIIDKYSVNHSTLDYQKFLVSNKIDEYKDSRCPKIYIIWIEIRTYFWVFLSAIAPLLFILVFVLKYKQNA